MFDLSAQSSLKKIHLIIIVIVASFISGVLGYSTATLRKPASKPIAPVATPSTPTVFTNPSIIKSQQATAVGIITKVQDDQIIVEGDDKSSISLKLSPKLTIYIPAANGVTANKPSTNKSDIKLNQKALINLIFEYGVLTVTTISYLPT